MTENMKIENRKRREVKHDDYNEKEMKEETRCGK